MAWMQGTWSHPAALPLQLLPCANVLRVGWAASQGIVHFRTIGLKCFAPLLRYNQSYFLPPLLQPALCQSRGWNSRQVYLTEALPLDMAVGINRNSLGIALPCKIETNEAKKHEDVEYQQLQEQAKSSCHCHTDHDVISGTLHTHLLQHPACRHN